MKSWKLSNGYDKYMPSLLWKIRKYCAIERGFNTQTIKVWNEYTQRYENMFFNKKAFLELSLLILKHGEIKHFLEK